MSRAYRIRVKESISQDLSASDEVCSDLEILEILPSDQMADLLSGELKGRGFEEKEGWSYDDVGPRANQVKKQLSDQAKQDLERRAQRQQEKLQSEATEQLEG